MKRRHWTWGYLFALGLAGCGRLPASVTPPPAQSAQNSIQEALRGDNARSITLQVQDLSEVKVQIGDFIVKGQVLGDREDLRQDLEIKREQLRLELAALERPAIQPSASTTQVEAERQQAEDRLQRATQDLNQAEAALADFRSQLPWTDYALDNLPLSEEHLQLESLQAKIETARAELQAAKEAQQNVAGAVAALQQIRERQATAQAQNEQRLKAVQERLADLDGQIAEIQPIRSPVAGTVTAVTPSAQPPNLQVVITVVPESFALPPTPL
ncbi:hypothetical protein GS597_01820 [Synechococcales cyanobacterium C]|uniref:Uncharacterized protein n=1 Tax=Petrachloros mirabilis ULC683 TaxID=2781853 RepID=A0A8K1ZWQ8_9CYAN|nr:hypothetical protein [Petrachloros mirabilis]NCJ05273.1 hypothetical protein [Petrachloros mirabilis ULC683]